MRKCRAYYGRPTNPGGRLNIDICIVDHVILINTLGKRHHLKKAGLRRLLSAVELVPTQLLPPHHLRLRSSLLLMQTKELDIRYKKTSISL